MARKDMKQVSLHVNDHDVQGSALHVLRRALVREVASLAGRQDALSARELQCAVTLAEEAGVETFRIDQALDQYLGPGDEKIEKATDGLSVKEAAAELGVSYQTVHDWIRAGRLPATQFGARRVRIARGDLRHVRGPAKGAA